MVRKRAQKQTFSPRYRKLNFIHCSLSPEKSSSWASPCMPSMLNREKNDHFHGGIYNGTFKIYERLVSYQAQPTVNMIQLSTPELHSSQQMGLELYGFTPAGFSNSIRASPRIQAKLVELGSHCSKRNQFK